MTAGWSERHYFLFQFCECYTFLADESSSGVILIVICAIFQSVIVSCWNMHEKVHNINVMDTLQHIFLIQLPHKDFKWLS